MLKTLLKLFNIQILFCLQAVRFQLKWGVDNSQGLVLVNIEIAHHRRRKRRVETPGFGTEKRSNNDKSFKEVLTSGFL